jgi:hypothetical protein
MKRMTSIAIFFFFSVLVGIAQPSLKPGGIWTVIASWESPDVIKGFTSDGTDFYVYRYPGGIYRFNPQDSTFLFLFPIPEYIPIVPHQPPPESNGLTYKNPYLVTTQMQMATSMHPSVTLALNANGTVATAYPCPDPWISQISWDTDHYWGTQHGGQTIYKFNATGNSLDTIYQTITGVENLFASGQEIWLAGTNDSLVKIDANGMVIETHPAMFGHPSAIYSDGSFIWYSVTFGSGLNQRAKIMKVDPNGTGTPLLNPDTAFHNFGMIQLEDSATWTLKVHNPGEGSLTIYKPHFQQNSPFHTTTIFPLAVAPGDSAIIHFTFAPLSSGTFNTTVFLQSNDPIFSSQPIALQGIGVYPGAHLTTDLSQHGFGIKRLRSTTGWKLRIANDGTQPLILTDIISGNNAFYPDRYLDFPVEIPVRDSLDIRIWFQPRESKDYSTQLEIFSNSLTQNPVGLSLTGTGKDTAYSAGYQLWNYNVPPYLSVKTWEDYPKAMLPVQDINGDSVPDLVVNFYEGWTVCLNGNASGTADVIWANYNFFGNCRDRNGIAAIPDIDGDFLNDIIIAPWHDHSLYAWSGRTGKLIWKHDFQQVALEQIDVRNDYNGDAFPDVLLALSDLTGTECSNPDNVYCFDGKTGSIIWVARTLLCAYSVKGIEDFTGDGKPDVIAGVSNSDKNPANLFGLNGTNGQKVWSSSITAAPVTMVQIDDYTGDGIRDIAVAEIGFDNSAYLRQINSASGESEFQVWKGHEFNAVKMEDLGKQNGDTTRGLLFSGCYPVSKNAMPGGWRTWEFQAGYAANAGDLNGDGVNDVFFGRNKQVGYLNGKDGSILDTFSLINQVYETESFHDLIGNGYQTIIAGGADFICCLAGAKIHSSGPGMGEENTTTLRVFPNPASDFTDIEFTSPVQAPVKLEIIKMTGNVVKTLIDKTIPAGIHKITWAFGTEWPAGIYLVRLLTTSGVCVRKLVHPSPP